MLPFFAQVEGVIHFKMGLEDMGHFDSQILDVCTGVNTILEQMQAKGIPLAALAAGGGSGAAAVASQQ